MKTIPVRMDIVTRKTYPKEELLRFVVFKGVVTLDKGQVLPGRGCYVKKDEESLQKAFSKKLISRHLHLAPGDELLEKAREAL